MFISIIVMIIDLIIVPIALILCLLIRVILIEPFYYFNQPTNTSCANIILIHGLYVYHINWIAVKMFIMIYELFYDIRFNIIIVKIDYSIYFFEMSMKDFQIMTKLGEGAFSIVYKVKRLGDGMEYALKKVRGD